MPFQRKPIKRASRKRNSASDRRKSLPKLRKSERFVLRGNENISVSKATAAARKSVALINGLDVEKKNHRRMNAKSRHGASSLKRELEQSKVSPICYKEDDISMDIVIHIEIERVEISALTEKTTELQMPEIYEECTPDCLPMTPRTPPSPLANYRIATSVITLRSRSPHNAELVPFEHDPDVLRYFRERELCKRPKPNYLQQQPQIDRAARAFLINWLVIIARERELDTEALYHATSYIDRFLSDVVIQRSKLQIVGLACLHIALKFEISRPPSIAKLAAIGNADLDVRQIIQMEEIILKALTFDLRLPTVFTFISAFAAATKVPNLLKYLAMYICELTLLEAEPYLQFLPSQVAAAAYALARYILGYDIWSQQLADVTNCRLESLKQVFLCLCRTHAAASKILTKAIQMKYLEKEYNEVALLSAVCVNEPLFDYLVEYYYSLGV